MGPGPRKRVPSPTSLIVDPFTLDRPVGRRRVSGTVVKKSGRHMENGRTKGFGMTGSRAATHVYLTPISQLRRPHSPPGVIIRSRPPGPPGGKARGGKCSKCRLPHGEVLHARYGHLVLRGWRRFPATAGDYAAAVRDALQGKIGDFPPLPNEDEILAHMASTGNRRGALPDTGAPPKK